MKSKNLKEKDYVILSGYIRYRPKNKSYYLMVNSRLLVKYLISKKKKNRVKVSRDKDLFVINLDKKGNFFNPREKEIVTSISGNILLKDMEKEQLKSNNTKFSFPIKIKLFPSEFKLNKYFFYPDKDAAKLAYELERSNIILPKRIMTPKAFDHDLEFDHKNKRVVIEITQITPRDSNYMNFKHQPVGGIVRAHIFDIYRKCVNSRLSNKNNIMGFIILHNDWKNFKHITKLIPEFIKLRCYIIFSEFRKDWNKKCSKEIINKIK
jgi:hypothetical protein